jgi:transcription antitermination factor NusG
MARPVMGGGRRKQAGAPEDARAPGDRVRVIRGNFAGQEGTVLRVLTKENRVVSRA